jgi:hypothetical protein
LGERKNTDEWTFRCLKTGRKCLNEENVVLLGGKKKIKSWGDYLVPFFGRFLGHPELNARRISLGRSWLMTMI